MLASMMMLAIAAGISKTARRREMKQSACLAWDAQGCCSVFIIGMHSLLTMLGHTRVDSTLMFIKHFMQFVYRGIVSSIIGVGV